MSDARRVWRAVKWKTEILAELEALKAIFGEEHVSDNLNDHSICLKGLDPCLYDPASVISDSQDRQLLADKGLAPSATFDVDIKVPETYPDAEPCLFKISAHWLTQSELDMFAEAAMGFFEPSCEMLVAAVLHLTTELPVDQLHQNLRGALSSIKNDSPPNRASMSKETEGPVVIEEDETGRLKEGQVTISERFKLSIHHGRLLIDRKSVFQGHYATVMSMEEVQDVIATLYKYNRIARAAHNIVAYRFEMTKPMTGKHTGESSKVLHQDHDSDGEGGAGSNMQWLMDIMKASNALVIVSRWWGGIKLGPDRFRHINTLTREMLEQYGQTADRDSKQKPRNKK